MDELKPISHKEFNKFIKGKGFKGRKDYTLKDPKAKLGLKGSRTKTLQTKPLDINPLTKPPKTKNPRQKPPRVNFLCFIVLKIFMVSQVHNLLIVQWLPV